jgi:hypothetical protein
MEEEKNQSELCGGIPNTELIEVSEYMTFW